MKYIITFILVNFISINFFGQTDTLNKKRNKFYGLNFSSSKLLSTLSEGGSNGVFSNYLSIEGKKGFEVEGYFMFDFLKDFYLKPSVAFSKNNYATHISKTDGYFTNIYSSPNSGSPIGQGPVTSLTASMDFIERYNRLKWYLPLGKLIQISNHYLFFEAGFGFNKIIDKSQQSSVLLITLNKENFPEDKIRNKLLAIYDANKKGFDSRVFYKIAAGAIFKIKKNLFINVSSYFEISNFLRDERVFSLNLNKLNIYLDNTSSFYFGLNAGLLFSK